MAITALCLVVAACGTGAESGTGEVAADNPDAPASDSVVTTESVVTTATTRPEPVEMPELLGMTEAEARLALTDLGFDEPVITTRESFEAAGTVLEQLPSGGRVVTGTVSLVVADAVAAVPDFVGKPIAEARAWADPRGIEIREQTKLVTDSGTGTVLEQIPTAGAAASEELVLAIAQAPTIVELANLTPVDKQCFVVEDMPLNGNLYPKSLALLDRYCKPGFVSFDLGRDWSSLQLTAGLHDRLDANAAVQVEIQGDGQVLYSETVSFGQTIDAEVDVTDILRLNITASILSGRETKLGLANAQLLGGTGITTTTTG